jgi:hypothetical protein
MTSVETHAQTAPTSRLPRLLRWPLKGIWVLCRLLLLWWGTMAIYFSNLPWSWARLVLAVGFALFGAWALFMARKPAPRWAFAGLFLGVVAWFATIQPTFDRPWRQEVAVMPRAVIDGNRVRISGYRYFEYRSRDDFTVRHEEREYDLDHITGLDFYVSYWKIGPVGHTFVSFLFDNAPPLCISIETRPEVGEGFAPIASLFKQFELIYVVGDENDLVRVRTHHRNEEVFLYHIKTTPDAARRLLMVYLERINELAERPEWYHLLKNSCTINIVRYANAAGRIGSFHIGHLLNGWIDRYLYAAGVIDTSLPFAELRERAHINAAARAADDNADFSKQIRINLPADK